MLQRGRRRGVRAPPQVPPTTPSAARRTRPDARRGPACCRSARHARCCGRGVSTRPAGLRVAASACAAWRRRRAAHPAQRRARSRVLVAAAQRARRGPLAHRRLRGAASPVARRACFGMQRAAAPPAATAALCLPQPQRLLALAAAPRRACAVLASRLPPHELRGALCCRAPPREPPAALRRALLSPLRAVSRPGRSCLARAAEVRRSTASNPNCALRALRSRARRPPAAGVS